MTTGYNIFKDKTPMPMPTERLDTPVRTAQTNTESKGARLPGEQKSSDMAVEACCRPRRGHDY